MYLTWQTRLSGDIDDLYLTFVFLQAVGCDMTNVWFDCECWTGLIFTQKSNGILNSYGCMWKGYVPCALTPHSIYAIISFQFVPVICSKL